MNRTRRRGTRLVTGLLLVACSLGLIGVGAFAAWARSGGTYLDLGAHGSYQTDRHGLATDSTDWRTTMFGWVGSVRLKVASEDQQPIFVGVAATDAVADYLSGVDYTVISEHTDGDGRTDHDGEAPAVPPDQAVDWTARAEGVGTQSLRWSATDGRQTAVAVNADGSRPVRVQVVSSAVTLDRMPWWMPVGPLALGVILLLPGVVVLRRTLVRSTPLDATRQLR